MIRLPIVSRKRYQHALEMITAQTEITKYYQRLYAEALAMQEPLNRMLKEATSLQEKREGYVRECD